MSIPSTREKARRDFRVSIIPSTRFEHKLADLSQKLYLRKRVKKRLKRNRRSCSLQREREREGLGNDISEKERERAKEIKREERACQREECVCQREECVCQKTSEKKAEKK